jgi:hypothetical protein
VAEDLPDEEGWASLVPVLEESREGAPRVLTEVVIASSDLIV